MSERRDLFGRTEAELLAAIASAERIYKISMTYSGNEGLALLHARMRSNLDVDRRQLAIMRGEKVVGQGDQRRYMPSGVAFVETREIAPSALAKWRREFMALGYYSKGKR